MAQCPDCHSVKVFPGINEGDGKCAVCYGTGNPDFADALVDSVNILGGEKSKCTKCKGSGVCQTCFGTGIVKTREPAPPAKRPANDDSSSSEDNSGCVMLVVGAVVFMVVLAALLLSAPVWLGAAAVSSITAFFYSKTILEAISPEAVASATIEKIQAKTKTKWRLHKSFSSEQIKNVPHMLVVCGSGFAYALLTGLLGIFLTGDDITRIIMGAAILLGGFLAYYSGKKVLSWRLEEAVLLAHSLPTGGNAIRARIALGLSCIGIVFLSLVMIEVIADNRPRQRTSPHNQETVSVSEPSAETTRSQSSSIPAPVIQNPLNNIPQSSSNPLVQSNLSKSSFQPENLEIRAHTTKLPATDAVNDFVVEFLAAENGSDLSRSMSKYADRVEYFDNGWVNRDFVQKDKADYRNKWISHQETLSGSIKAQKNTDGSWTINYSTRFHVQDSKGAWIDGEAANTLRITGTDSGYSIVYQNVSVANRRKGTSTVPEGVTQKIAGTQPEQNFAFSGRWNGVVHVAKSPSGRNESFNVKLQIGSSEKSGTLYTEHGKLASLSTTRLDATQIRMIGYFLFEGGKATITLVARPNSSRTVVVSIRTDTTKGGWSVMEGTLGR